jgi:hypothetical protein
MEGITTYLSILTLNGLNSPIKRQKEKRKKDTMYLDETLNQPGKTVGEDWTLS